MKKKIVALKSYKVPIYLLLLAIYSRNASLSPLSQQSSDSICTCVEAFSFSSACDSSIVVVGNQLTLSQGEKARREKERKRRSGLKGERKTLSLNQTLSLSSSTRLEKQEIDWIPQYKQNPPEGGRESEVAKGLSEENFEARRRMCDGKVRMSPNVRSHEVAKVF